MYLCNRKRNKLNPKSRKGTKNMKQNKYNYSAKVEFKNMHWNLSYNEGRMLIFAVEDVYNTLKHVPCNLKSFRHFVEVECGAKVVKTPVLRTGQYINVKTGKVESLWGC